MPDYDRFDWIARQTEAAIDPDRPIVDAHHHLWRRDGADYVAEQLAADCGASHNITHTVFVECSASYDTEVDAALAPVGETRFVAEEADRFAALGAARIGAIVGHADLLLGDAVDRVLNAHVEAARGLFRGVRHGTNWSPHSSVKNGHHQPFDRQLADPRFQQGLRALGAAGLSFDAWLYFHQLGELADTARAVPETMFVVNHLGGPLGIGPHSGAGRLSMLEAWQRGIEAVAACPNTVCKVGGLGMEHYFGMKWSQLSRPPSSEVVAAWWSEIVHFAIEAFGPNRCMFESNYPVDRQTVPYTVLWNAFQRLAARYSESEQQALFHDTATQVYRIEH